MGAIWFKSGASWQWGELTWICEVNMKPAGGLSCCIGTTVLSCCIGTTVLLTSDVQYETTI